MFQVEIPFGLSYSGKMAVSRSWDGHTQHWNNLLGTSILGHTMTSSHQVALKMFPRSSSDGSTEMTTSLMAKLEQAKVRIYHVSIVKNWGWTRRMGASVNHSIVTVLASSKACTTLSGFYVEHPSRSPWQVDPRARPRSAADLRQTPSAVAPRSVTLSGLYFRPVKHWQVITLAIRAHLVTISTCHCV